MPSPSARSGRRRLLMVGPDSIALHSLRSRSDIEIVTVYGADRKDAGRAPVDGAFTQVFAEDSTDLECVLAALARAGEPLDGFDGVYTKDEQSVVMAAALGQLGGIRTVTVDVALRFRDKSLQKARLRQSGIPTADSRVIDDILDFDPETVTDLLPAVAKPIAGAGTQGTTLARDRAQLAQVAETVRTRANPPRTFLLEQFMAGEEWTCDGIVFDGEVLFMVLGRYADPCLTTVSERRPFHVYKFSPDLIPDAYEQAAPVVSGALSALGLDFGNFHMELFYTPDSGTFAFSECAARRGGGLTQEQIVHQFGVDLAAASIDCAVGLKPDVTGTQVRTGVSGSSFLPMRGGYLVSCPDAAAVAAQPHVDYARIEAPLGAYMPDVATDLFAHKLGQVMVFGPDQPTVARYLDETAAWFHSRVETIPPNASGRELRARSRAAGFSFESGLD